MSDDCGSGVSPRVAAAAARKIGARTPVFSCATPWGSGPVERRSERKRQVDRPRSSVRFDDAIGSAVNTRVLFLDDSGKPDANHASNAVVIAGFSVPSEHVPTMSRRVLGAKGKFFAKRGQPTTWEIKAADVIKPNPWKRRANREFAFELVRIVGALDGTVYSVAIDKSKMKHPMSLAQTMPLQLRALVDHFEVECRHHGETGMLVAYWSSHQADQHASSCVASFVASRGPADPPVGVLREFARDRGDTGC